MSLSFKEGGSSVQAEETAFIKLWNHKCKEESRKSGLALVCWRHKETGRKWFERWGCGPRY